jgi:hypothetical protein
MTVLVHGTLNAHTTHTTLASDNNHLAGHGPHLSGK